ncbi:MAG: cytidylyltransferase domain-containing protein [Flavobacterium sp.]
MAKTGAVIQVRYNSTRLPGKVLLELPFASGKTLLSRIVDRLLKVDDLDVIIATSNQPDDDPIAAEAEKLGVKLYRGSKDNVLDRYCEAAKTFGLDHIIRITGDNPIVLTDIISKNIKAHVDGGYDYTRNINLPYGTSFEIASAEALYRSRAMTKDEQDLEHVTIFIKKNPDVFSINEMNHFPGQGFDGIRLTVDYPADYALMNIICTHFQHKDYVLDDVLGFLKMNPWLQSINNNSFQKRQFGSFEEEKVYALEVMDILDMKNVRQKIENLTS